MADLNYSVTISFPPDVAEKLRALQKSYSDRGIDLSFNKLVLSVLKQADDAGLLEPLVQPAKPKKK